MNLYKYLQWVNKGEDDIAVILDVQNQDDRQRNLAELRHTQASSPLPLGGIGMVGERKTLARKLGERLPGNEAAICLASETPPDNQYPIIVIMDGRIDFFYRVKP